MVAALAEGLRRLPARNDDQRAAILSDVPAYALWAVAQAAGVGVDELIAEASGTIHSRSEQPPGRHPDELAAELHEARSETAAVLAHLQQLARLTGHYGELFGPVATADPGDEESAKDRDAS